MPVAGVMTHLTVGTRWRLRRPAGDRDPFVRTLDEQPHTAITFGHHQPSVARGHELRDVTDHGDAAGEDGGDHVERPLLGSERARPPTVLRQRGSRC